MPPGGRASRRPGQILEDPADRVQLGLNRRDGFSLRLGWIGTAGKFMHHSRQPFDGTPERLDLLDDALVFERVLPRTLQDVLAITHASDALKQEEMLPLQRDGGCHEGKIPSAGTGHHDGLTFQVAVRHAAPEHLGLRQKTVQHGKDFEQCNGRAASRVTEGVVEP